MRRDALTIWSGYTVQYDDDDGVDMDVDVLHTLKGVQYTSQPPYTATVYDTQVVDEA